MKYAGISYTIKSIRLSLVEENSAQPSTRGEREKLKESMAEKGQKDPIDLAVKGDRFVILDGHGRVWAAKELGWTEILAKVYDVRSKEEMAELQTAVYGAESAKMKFSGAQWVEYVHNLTRKGSRVFATDAEGDYIIELPSNVRKTYRFVVDSYPREVQDNLIFDLGLSPSAFASAIRYARELAHAGRRGVMSKRQESEVRAAMPDALAWVVRFGMTYPLREWLEQGRSIDTVRTCIKAEKPLPGYARKASAA